LTRALTVCSANSAVGVAFFCDSFARRVTRSATGAKIDESISDAWVFATPELTVNCDLIALMSKAFVCEEKK